MPDELSTGADTTGAASGASTGDQSGATGQPAAGADGAHVNDADSAASGAGAEEVDEEAAADAALAGETEDEEVDDDKVDESKPGEETNEADKAAEPKSIKEARSHIHSLEEQLRPLRDLENHVLDIGGLPTLEAAKPLFDVVMNPEAGAVEIFEALAQVAPFHDQQDLAWKLLENQTNQAAAVAHFYGENVTPDILTKLVEGYEAGDFKIELDGEADDVFLTDAERRERENKRVGTARDEAKQRAEKDAATQELAGQRQASTEKIAKLCQDSVGAVLAPYAVVAGDTDEVKGLKGFVNDGINAIIMFQLHGDPQWQRVQKLLKANAFSQAETIMQGALGIKIGRMAESLTNNIQPFVKAGIGQAQKHAKKVKELRNEPSGATTQGDITKPKEQELSAKDPKWREKLDSEYAGKIKAIIDRGKARRPRS